MVSLNLSSDDRREAILALTVAIAHESRIVSRLEADDEFCVLRGAIQDRRQQMDLFQRLLAKLVRGVATGSQ
jgi:hypothetical protein